MTKFIAEIGGNHKGDFDLAKAIVMDCLKSKADIIKLQLYSATGLVNVKQDKTRHEHFKTFELSRGQYIELAKMIKDHGKLFCVSVWDVSMMEWIYPYVDVWKIGSGDFTSLPLIEKVYEFGKPVILSTGLCSKTEVDSVISKIRDFNNFDKVDTILMQCTSMYPIPYVEANLAVIDDYSNSYVDVSVGYSDHTIGSDALRISIAKGVDFIEFHYTLNSADTTFRDNLVSLERRDVQELDLWREKVVDLLGSPLKTPTNSEIESGHVKSFRRSVYVNRNVLKGESIRYSDLVFLRPYVDNSLSPIDVDRQFHLIANKDYDYLDPIFLY
jgi:N,N'-diacetyllegionaminate synthase